MAISALSLICKLINVSVADNTRILLTTCSCASASISRLHGCCTDPLPPGVAVGEIKIWKLFRSCKEEKKKALS